MYHLYIVDNGLDKLSGHHYNQAIGLLHGAKQLGYKATVYSAYGASKVPEICAIATPTFQKVLYRLDPFTQIEEHARFFFSEVDAFLPALDTTDVLLLPNANYDEISAISLLIEKRKLTQHVIVRLLYYPHAHEAEYFACLEKLKRFPNVHLVTSSLPYSAWLNDLGFTNRFIGGPPHVLPFEKARQVSPQYEFAYLGQAAKTKGFEHIINALLMGAQQGYTPKTLLHSKNYTFPADLLASMSHITVIPDAVSEALFYEHLFSAKCVLAYYDPANYQLQDSAIVTEALALERYVLASPLPFISQTYGAEFFDFACTPNAWDAQALLEKMRAISSLASKPACVLRASEEAKLLSCPTLFLAKMLAK
jgi:hypothetical protein